MLENGKIMVVVVVLAIILIGIMTYLFTIQRKVKKLEKEIEDKKAENNQ
jgi:CcmD family protein